ncbi:MAG: thymidine kinase [Candidatus Thorarchaeota archaeon]
MPAIYRPGYLEAIFGPMKSGKSEQLIRFFRELNYSEIKGVAFKPKVDIRDKKIASRAFDFDLDAIIINESHPELIFQHLEGSDYKIIGIDEAQFFDNRLVDVVDDLLKAKYHIIVSGLMLSFRGEPFGPMPWIVGRANKIVRLTAICDYPGCNQRATRTQRLINGKPAQYNTPLVLIEGTVSGETHEARCVLHHVVPK